MLLVLSTSCVTRPAVSIPVSPCIVPEQPALKVDYEQCGDNTICMTVADAVALAVWMQKEAEYRQAVSRCPYVKETPDG
jgi:hypothetical protein